MLKWQRLKMLVAISCALTDEERLWQALSARFPLEKQLPAPVIVIDPKRRRWEIYDTAFHWFQPAT